jgi:hypothetical protein
MVGWALKTYWVPGVMATSMTWLLGLTSLSMADKIHGFGPNTYGHGDLTNTATGQALIDLRLVAGGYSS